MFNQYCFIQTILESSNNPNNSRELPETDPARLDQSDLAVDELELY